MHGDDAAPGKFITLEGGEGAGKSTQAARLIDALRGAGIDAIATREPGGAPGAEEIRELLVRGEVARWEPITEALLHTAARVEHLQKTVHPALAAGRWVVSDRFADSTTAYQGYGHGVERDALNQLYRLAVGDFMPDLTVILDLEVDEGLKRATAGPDGEDRYERMDKDFHRRLKDGFLEIAAGEPDRCVVIDASADVDTVAAQIRKVVGGRLGVDFP